MHKANTAAGASAKMPPAAARSNMDTQHTMHGDNCHRYYRVAAVRHLRDELLQQEFSAAGYRLIQACDLILADAEPRNGR